VQISKSAGKMSAIEKLGSSLVNALKKIMRVPVVDEAAVKDLVKDVQRALLQSDVNVQLVLEISRRLEERSLKEKIPPGISRREHVVKVLYDELSKFLGEKPAKISVEPGKTKIYMLVGIQGAGKTTTAAKLARYFQKRGVKPALICADTYRPGAYAQLKQMAEKIGVPVYSGDEDAIKTAINGVEKFRREKRDLIIIDTAGRHKDEKSLIEEMKRTAKVVKPDEIILIVDATMGQQAISQAEAFNKATGIGSILVSKLDSSARGGGALSAVATTGAPVKFIGTGEKINDLEPFIPSRFVGRILGMGDVEGLVQKVREAELSVPEKRAKEIFRGKFTLQDMYQQIEGVKSVGTLKQILKMVPGAGYNVPDEAVNVAEDKMEKWKYIIQSMTKEERDDPKMLKSSRVKRVAFGSGTTEKNVKELVKQYFLMKKYMKTFRRKRLPQNLLKKFQRKI
jgi:signal recognition particle subunit SRP54